MRQITLVMKYEMNEDQEVLVQQLTHKLAQLDSQIKASKDYEKEALIEEKKLFQSHLEDLRFGAIIISYSKKSESEKWDFWKEEFSNLMSLHLAFKNLYEIFDRESYTRWVEIAEDFDEYLIRICDEFNLEYELAYTLCELNHGSDDWKRIIENNEE